MPAEVITLPLHAGKKIERKPGVTVVSTVSKANGWERGLSPFVLGPCVLYDGYTSRNVENGWQYSKVYARHTDLRGGPSRAYFQWAEEGWANERAVRYPMGRGARPEYSWWAGECLPYIDARKVIYGPLYVRAVRDTLAFARLKQLYKRSDVLVLLDYDAYDRGAKTLTQVLNDPDRKMGHAFVLEMMLREDDALAQLEV